MLDTLLCCFFLIRIADFGQVILRGRILPYDQPLGSGRHKVALPCLWHSFLCSTESTASLRFAVV